MLTCSALCSRLVASSVRFLFSEGTYWLISTSRVSVRFSAHQTRPCKRSGLVFFFGTACVPLGLQQEINAIRQQLSEEPLQGGEAPAGTVAPYGQRARVTPERLAFVIREQWKTFNQVRYGTVWRDVWAFALLVCSIILFIL